MAPYQLQCSVEKLAVAERGPAFDFVVASLAETADHALAGMTDPALAGMTDPALARMTAPVSSRSAPNFDSACLAVI